jgi:hypothetical protein
MSKNLYYPKVYGIGYEGEGNYVKTIKRKHTKVYNTWSSMLERCYSEKWHIRYTTYKDCSVDKRWYNFQVFGEWFEQNYVDGFVLDKDILFKGNKIYSPETCCFVPQEVNTLFIKCDKVRGKYPIGVRKKGNKFYSRMSKNKEAIFIGSFNNSEDAFQAYKIAKESYIKEVANKYKTQITEACYKALVDYQVNIND